MSGPDGVIHHGRLRRPSAIRSLLAVVGTALAVTLVATGSIAAIAVWQLSSDIETETIDADREPPPDLAAYEGGFNILIVGSDSREGQGDEFGDTDGAELNDVNMLLHVAEDRRSATLVSIPRDLVVPFPECEDGGPATGLPMNNALALGGLNCAVRTVQELTGLTIQFAGIIQFDGVIAMSNAVGGVDVCIDAPILDPASGLHLKSAGTHTLQGWSALAFLRTRKGVGDGSDLGRINAQQVFLSSLVRKIKSDGTLGDLGKLWGLARAATEHMTLSEHFSDPLTLVQIALVLKDIPLEGIAMTQYPSVYGADGTIYEGKLRPVESLAASLFDAIRNDQPIRFDEDAIGGDNTGSILDPDVPPPTPMPEETTTAAPDDGGSDPVVLPGLKGQPASTHTCAVAN